MHRSPLFGESEIHIFHDIAIFIKMLYHLLFILFIVFPLKYLHGFFKMSYFCFEIILERVSVVCCSNVSLAISLRIYRFKFNNSNSRKICKIWLNLTRFTRSVSFLDFTGCFLSKYTRLIQHSFICDLKLRREANDLQRWCNVSKFNH